MFCATPMFVSNFQKKLFKSIYFYILLQQSFLKYLLNNKYNKYILYYFL